MVNGRTHVMPFLTRMAIAVVLALPAILALAPAAIASQFTVDGTADAAEPPVPPAPPEPPVPPAPSLPSLPSLPEDPAELVDLVTPLPSRLMLSARPRHARNLPVRFRLSGWLMPPRGLARVADFFQRTLGIDVGVCKGHVTVAFKASGRTLASRRASVTRTCRFGSGIRIRSRRHVGRARRLKATTRFGGNSILAPAQRSITLQIGQRVPPPP